jgi:hypothetical protein
MKSKNRKSLKELFLIGMKKIKNMSPEEKVQLDKNTDAMRRKWQAAGADIIKGDNTSHKAK